MFSVRFLARVGMEVADWRFLNAKTDLVVTDILVGADNYRKIVSPHKLPKLVLGMWLNYTPHGDVLLSGKIPGSTSAKVDSLNIVTIGNTCHKILPSLEIDEEVSKCNSNGQPVAGFPWIDIKKVLSKSFTFSILLFLLIFFIFSPSQEEIGFNFELVKSRFDAVMKSPDKSPVKLAQYEKVHIKEVENKFVELVRAPATKSILQPIGGDTWKEGQLIL